MVPNSSEEAADLLQRGPLQERFAGGEPFDIFHGGAGDIVQGLAGQERLVCCDEHVGERQQSRQDVVLKDLAGEVLEEDTLVFLLIAKANPQCPRRAGTSLPWAAPSSNARRLP